jgi:hypothetical protein
MWYTWERREKCTRLLVGKPERKRLLGRPRHRWEDGIVMDLREMGWECGVDSVSSEWGPVAGSSEHGDESSSSRGTEFVRRNFGWF